MAAASTGISNGISPSACGRFGIAVAAQPAAQMVLQTLRSAAWIPHSARQALESYGAVASRASTGRPRLSRHVVAGPGNGHVSERRHASPDRQLQNKCGAQRRVARVRRAESMRAVCGWPARFAERRPLEDCGETLRTRASDEPQSRAAPPHPDLRCRRERQLDRKWIR